MKTAKIVRNVGFILVLVLSLASVASAADIFSVKTALNAPQAQKNCEISVLSGEVLEFSAADLEMRLGLQPQSLNGITVTSLPKSEQGELVLEGVGVDAFDFIERENVDKLCFVPREDAVAASIMFIPKAKDSAAAELDISVLAEPNLPPQIQNGTYDTARNVAVSGYILATDPEGDDLQIRVIKPPVNGSVQFNGLNFRYTPYKNVSGKDSFTVCAVDSANNFSGEASVSINIERLRGTFFYADMATHPSAYAAIKLRENKVMSGAQIGNQFFFFPNETTTRGEFLVMLMAASGMEDSMKPTVNTGLSNDAEIPSWLKPYVKKAIDEDVWSSQPFFHDQIPTRAEAVVLTDRVAKIVDVKDFALQMSDLGSIPDWALPSYKALAAYRMLDLHDNTARPADGLTNSYSADLIWQLWKHYSR